MQGKAVRSPRTPQYADMKDGATGIRKDAADGNPVRITWRVHLGEDGGRKRESVNFLGTCYEQMLDVHSPVRFETKHIVEKGAEAGPGFCPGAVGILAEKHCPLFSRKENTSLIEQPKDRESTGHAEYSFP